MEKFPCEAPTMARLATSDFGRVLVLVLAPSLKMVTTSIMHCYVSCSFECKVNVEVYMTHFWSLDLLCCKKYVLPSSQRCYWWALSILTFDSVS